MPFSRILAVVIGILAPLGDTIRRWSTWQEQPFSLLDDYFLGAFLLFAAWLPSRNPKRGRLVLAAAWGFTTAVAAMSFVGQLHRLQTGEPDPAPIASAWVAVIKGLGLVLAVTAMVVTICSTKKPSGDS